MNKAANEHDGAGSESSGRRNASFRELEGADLPSNLEFIRLLGQGSMARVYLARNNSLKRLVAIKVLHKELAADAIGCKRFVREAQSAARISHPCVTSVYSVGELDNKIPYIEMEYVDGSNLEETLRSRGRFDVPAARKLLAQLASALSAAHDTGIIHRNVNPANVLIEHDSHRAFLTDFGVAGILESGSEAVTQLTRDNEKIGDPAYMSPEQLRGDPLTQQTDIYSLGLLGYEVLTLHGPFESSKTADMTRAHLRRPPLDLHTAHPDLPADLSDILKRCLSKQPEHRPRATDLGELFEVTNPAKANSGMDAAMVGAPQSVLVSFLSEAKKRHVYRAAVAYAAITFVVLQVADLVLPPFNAPEWVLRLIIVVSLAGFPVIVVLAWVFDLRQGQLLRTADAPSSFSRKTSRMQRLMLQALGLTLSIVLAAIAAWWLLAPGD